MSTSPLGSPRSSNTIGSPATQGPPTTSSPVLPSKDTIESIDPSPNTWRKRASQFFYSVWEFLLKYTFLGRFFHSTSKPQSPEGKSTTIVSASPLDQQIINSEGTSEPPNILAVQSSSSVKPSAQAENITTQTQTEIVHGKVYIRSSVTGYIGTDEHSSFKEILLLLSGKPVQIKPDDFYVRVEIRASDGTHFEAELPSSLFSQGCEGNTISFILENQRYRLELHSFLKLHINGIEHIPFDECLENLKNSLKSNIYEFLYSEDVPSDYFLWKCPEIQIYLSPATLQIEVGKQEEVPINFEKLQAIRTHYLPTILGITETDLVLEACGRPTIDILLDRYFLYIHIIRQPIKKQKNHRTIQQGMMDSFIHLVLDQPLRPSDIETSLNSEGVFNLHLLKGKMVDTRR